MNKKYQTEKDYEEFEVDDTRYYGVFLDKEKKVKGIDPNRFQQATGHSFTKEQLSVINPQNTIRFHPAKNKYYDYYCNQFERTIQNVRHYWDAHFKPLISIAWQRIKKPKEMHPSDCELLMNGIYEPDEGMTVVNAQNALNNARYNQECAKVVSNLYAQFIHYFASSVESITVAVLSKENAIDDYFDRNCLYATAVKTGKSIQDMPSHCWYDRLYCLWNFIKHNSASAYEKLIECYKDSLIENCTYHQGNFATYYVRFSDEMIVALIDGVSQFFKEYCELVFNEQYAVAQWNYEEFFCKIVWDEIELIVNPLGLSPFI